MFTKSIDIDESLKYSNKLYKIKNFIYKKRIYLIAFTVIFIAIIIIIIASSSGGSKKESKKPKENFEPFSNYYSPRTKNYINLLSSLEKENNIAYQYTFDNNSKGSFSNTFQDLYENDTSLIPNKS